MAVIQVENGGSLCEVGAISRAVAIVRSRSSAATVETRCV